MHGLSFKTNNYTEPTNSGKSIHWFGNNNPNEGSQKTTFSYGNTYKG